MPGPPNLRHREVDIAAITPNPENPRKIAPAHRAALKASIRRFGLVQPLIVNTRSGYLVGGHQRLDVLRELGYEKVPIIEVDLDQEQEYALNLVLNNPGAQGDFTASVDDLLNRILAGDLALYDELRLFDIGGYDDDVMKAALAEDPVPDMALQAFEHWDYVMVLCNDVRDWNWLTGPLLKLPRVNASPVGKRKVGLLRVVPFAQFKTRLEEFAQRPVDVQV